CQTFVLSAISKILEKDDPRHRAESEAWKSAKAYAERETLFKKSGLRYSILCELPYWDPIEFVVVEPMHLLSGILKRHAQMTKEIKKKQVRDIQFPESEGFFDEDTYAELRHEELNAGNNGIDLRLLQDALMKLEEEMRVNTEVNGPSVFTSDDLKLIRQVITQTKIPSWLNSPSLIFGDASANKMDLTMLKHAGCASNLGILLELLDLPTVVAKMASRFNQQKKLRLLLLDMSKVQHNNKEILSAKKLSKFRTNFLLPAHLHNQLISLLNLKYKPSGSQFVSEQKGNFSSSETIVSTVAKSIHSFKQAGLI
ncbi:hypothetical protein PSHT_14331, partial [Puccinia striiformis]